MFVLIKNKDKSAIYLDGVIKKARGSGEITPEFAMDILSKTNHRTNIKTLVKAVKDKCTTKEELLPYREFILSCVDGREVSGEAFDNLREMVKLCECEEEFDKANGKQKFYGEFDCNNTIIVRTEKDVQALEGDNLKVYFDADMVCLNTWISRKITALRFKEGAEVYSYCGCYLPENIDFSMCDEVYLRNFNLAKLNEYKFKEGGKVCFEGSRDFPEDVDLSQCADVSLKWCDLRNVKTLKFRDGAKVCLSQEKRPSGYEDDFDEFKGKIPDEIAYIPVVKYLPENLDVSMCDEVDLSGCDLSKFSGLKFKDGAKVCLDSAVLPRDLDVSMCDEVDLSSCNLRGIKELKLKEGAKCDLACAKNLPAVLNLSMCDEVWLWYANLRGVRKIKFKEGAKVCLSYAKHLPIDLDVSMCDKVDFKGCDFGAVLRVRFKDKEQKKIFLCGVENFSAMSVYGLAEDDEGKHGLGARLRRLFDRGVE